MRTPSGVGKQDNAEQVVDHGFLEGGPACLVRLSVRRTLPHPTRVAARLWNPGHRRRPTDASESALGLAGAAMGLPQLLRSMHACRTYRKGWLSARLSAGQHVRECTWRICNAPPVRAWARRGPGVADMSPAICASGNSWRPSGAGMLCDRRPRDADRSSGMLTLADSLGAWQYRTRHGPWR